MSLTVNNLEGNEIAADYSRIASERGRWGETWDVVKSSFWKLVLINIFMLIGFLPGVGILIVRSMRIVSLGALAPTNSNTGIGYPATPDMQGLAESIYLSADLLFYPLLIVAGFIASVGVAGGAYSIKKLLNSHGQFSIKGFFRGIKLCYFNTVLPATIFLAFLVATFLIGDWKDYVIASGGSAAGPIVAYVFIIIATVLVGIFCGWLFVVGISYRVSFLQLFKNAFVLIIGSPLQTIFFAGMALIPVWLYMVGSAVDIIKIISYIVFIFLGFSFILVIWLSFTQWVLDLYVTPNIKAAEAAAVGKTAKQLESEKQQDEKRVAMELLAAGKSELICKPILPISEENAVRPLGKTFTRSDMENVKADRQKLDGDIAAYEKEHLSDPVYAEYNKLFSEREKALKDDGKKSKKKKVSSKNLLGN